MRSVPGESQNWGRLGVSFLFFQIPHYRRQSHRTPRFSSGKDEGHPGTYLSRIFVFVCETGFHAKNVIDGCVSLKITPSMAASPQAKQMLETIKGAPTTKGFCRHWYPFRDRRSLLCHVTMWHFPHDGNRTDFQQNVCRAKNTLYMLLCKELAVILNRFI